jgi:hypothetical protein
MTSEVGNLKLTRESEGRFVASIKVPELHVKDSIDMIYNPASIDTQDMETQGTAQLRQGCPKLLECTGQIVAEQTKFDGWGLPAIGLTCSVEQCPCLD